MIFSNAALEVVFIDYLIILVILRIATKFFMFYVFIASRFSLRFIC